MTVLRNRREWLLRAESGHRAVLGLPRWQIPLAPALRHLPCALVRENLELKVSWCSCSSLPDGHRKHVVRRCAVHRLRCGLVLERDWVQLLLFVPGGLLDQPGLLVDFLHGLLTRLVRQCARLVQLPVLRQVRLDVRIRCF